MEELPEQLDLIAGHRLFRDMSRKEIMGILKNLDGKAVSFQKGDCLEDLMRSFHTQALGCVLSGWAQVCKDDVWGNRSILDFMMPNYLLGCYSTFTDANLKDFRTVATEPGQVLLLNASMLTDPSKCTDFPLLAKLEKNLITLLSERSWRMLKKLDILSGSSLREKVLMYLSYEAVYFGGMTFEIPFNRQGFADYLYADRSSLSRELSKLKAEGLIDFEHSRFTLFQTEKERG